MIASAIKDLEEAKKEKREAGALLTNRKNKVAAAQTEESERHRRIRATLAR
jgi:hypothetical protein